MLEDRLMLYCIQCYRQVIGAMIMWLHWHFLTDVLTALSRDLTSRRIVSDCVRCQADEYHQVAQDGERCRGICADSH